MPTSVGGIRKRRLRLADPALQAVPGVIDELEFQEQLAQREWSGARAGHAEGSRNGLSAVDCRANAVSVRVSSVGWTSMHPMSNSELQSEPNNQVRWRAADALGTSTMSTGFFISGRGRRAGCAGIAGLVFDALIKQFTPRPHRANRAALSNLSRRGKFDHAAKPTIGSEG